MGTTASSHATCGRQGTFGCIVNFRSQESIVATLEFMVNNPQTFEVQALTTQDFSTVDKRTLCHERKVAFVRQLQTVDGAKILIGYEDESSALKECSGSALVARLSNKDRVRFTTSEAAFDRANVFQVTITCEETCPFRIRAKQGVFEMRRIALVMQRLCDSDIEDALLTHSQLPYVIQTGRAFLARLHAYAVHCDIKPANMVVCTDRCSVNFRFIDFGLAMPIAAPLDQPYTSFARGTPLFMSPFIKCIMLAENRRRTGRDREVSTAPNWKYIFLRSVDLVACIRNREAGAPASDNVVFNKCVDIGYTTYLTYIRTLAPLEDSTALASVVVRLWQKSDEYSLALTCAAILEPAGDDEQNNMAEIEKLASFLVDPFLGGPRSGLDRPLPRF